MIQPLLFVHILAGAAALGAAGFALGSAKGGALHRRAGRVYALGMAIAGVTALVLAALRPNPFLFAIGVFSLYLVFTGWRAAVLRDGVPQLPDHLAGAAMATVGGVMLIWGAQGVITGMASQPVILLVFGTIGLTLALGDWRDWRKGAIIGKARIARHLSRMMAGTIATITAAMTVNLAFLPDLVAWLGPTVLLTPVVFWWNARILRASAN